MLNFYSINLLLLLKRFAKRSQHLGNFKLIYTMTAKNNLELNGNIGRNPVGELLVEINSLELSGSLRISAGEQKIVIYFDQGKLVFAVSNTREHRLFEILINENQISKEKITNIENFTNDFYLAKGLVKENLSTEANIATYFTVQIKQILESAVTLEDGKWTFSSLARIKEGIRFDIDINPILFKFAQNLDKQKILARFKSFDEEFCLNPESKQNDLSFTPPEAFILSRISDVSLSINDLQSMSGLPGQDVMEILYKLWFGGLIKRKKWNSAFSNDAISDIRSRRLKLKTNALSVEEELAQAEEEKENKRHQQEEAEAKKDRAEEKEKEKETKQIQISLEEYINRVEIAATHYEIFDVHPEAELEEIRKAYFSLAKNFHPDLFHKKVEPELLKKIQNAFTEIAQAYETLKDEEAREVYDFKLRKVLEKLKDERGNVPINITSDDLETQNQSVMAIENFDMGYDHLMNENYYEALPFLGRAVHLENDNARYHAFYGKALSFDKSQRHKAESELQTAIKLDSENTIYRIMLIELFIEIGLTVRARGELKRLLEVVPDNREAQSLLDSLDNK